MIVANDLATITLSGLSMYTVKMVGKANRILGMLKKTFKIRNATLWKEMFR